MIGNDRTPLGTSGPALYCAAKVPKRHSREVMETLDKWTEARDRLYAKIGSGFLVALIGNRGPGKTQLGQQIILAATATGRSALYVRAMTMIVELQTTNSAMATETRVAVIARYRAPSMLVIDEMQERGETDFEARMLNHIIDLRYGDMSDTLLVANLTASNLADSLGASIMDRLTESGGIVMCDWASFRKGDTP